MSAEPVLSVLPIRNLGLCYAAAMCAVAHAGRGSQSRVKAELLQGMRRIRRLTRGLADIRVGRKRGEQQSFTIFETPAWRLGAVRLGPDTRVPLHDHPGAYAFSQVLFGQIMVDAFSLIHRDARGVAYLHHAWTAKFGPEDTASIDPWDVNLHRLRASHCGAVVLTGAFASGASLGNRHWFFPIRESENGAIEAVALDRATMASKVRHASAGAARLPC